jgi:hypothetical protein
MARQISGESRRGLLQRRFVGTEFEDPAELGVIERSEEATNLDRIDDGCGQRRGHRGAGAWTDASFRGAGLGHGHLSSVAGCRGPHRSTAGRRGIAGAQ